MSEQGEAALCECGSGLAAERCCEGPPPGPGRALALAGVLLALAGLFVYQTWVAPPPPLPTPGVSALTSIPGFDLTTLDPARRERFLEIVNREDCPCPCDLSLASCLTLVESRQKECSDSRPGVLRVYEEVAGEGGPGAAGPSQAGGG